MKKLSETYKGLRIAFKFPIEIKDSKGNKTYFENSDGYWYKSEYDSDGKNTYYENSHGYWSKSKYDSDGKNTYYEDSEGFWSKSKYDSDGNEIYYENSKGKKKGMPRSQTCEGKVVEIDGIKYELKAL